MVRATVGGNVVGSFPIAAPRIFAFASSPSARHEPWAGFFWGLSVRATLRIDPAWSEKGRLEAVQRVDWMLI